MSERWRIRDARESNRAFILGIALLTVLAFFVWIALPLSAQEGRWGAADDPSVKAMIAMESMWASSNCSPQPGLTDVIATDFQGTTPDGSRYGKDEAIETDTIAVAYGDESSLRKNEAGEEKKNCLAWTDTWLRRKGKWQIVAAQNTYVHCK